MEAGDVLFVVVNILRRYGVDPEQALRASNGKFEKRFQAMESMLGGSIDDLSLDQQEDLWQRVKKTEE